MTTDQATQADDAPAPAAGDDAAPAPHVRDTRRGDWLAAGAYLLLALGVTARLWLHPNVMLKENLQDNVQFEWVLTNAVRTLRHLGDPFFSDLINAPNGVNLMANTSIWGLALPLS